jgi:hypothetical protein
VQQAVRNPEMEAVFRLIRRRVEERGRTGEHVPETQQTG